MKKVALADSQYAVGTISHIQPTAEVACLLQQSGRVLLQQSGRVTPFYKLLMADGTLLFSKKYRRVKSRNSYTISFCGESGRLFGEVVYFVMLNKEPVAIVNVLDNLSSCQEHFSLTHSLLDLRLFPVAPSNRLVLVPAKSIYEKCISVNVGQELYVAKFMSKLLLD